MQVLTNKSKKLYNYTSRYATIPFYYNTVDKRYMYGISTNIRDNTEYTVHQLSDTDTLDSLALKYYGRPDLYWVIADFNRISDPYTRLIDNFNFIYIPSLSAIRFN